MNRIAPWLLVAVLLPIHAFPQQKIVTYWSPSELRAGTREGGRANTVTVSSWHPNELFVASDSGGLWKSTDWGVTWTHVAGLPVSFTQSVVYLDRDTLLVSAKADFKTINGGGLWRTDDRGATWTQVPLPAPDSNRRLSAYEISVSGTYIVAGTSEGIFLSTDSGSSWSYSDPFGALFATRTVYSVLVTPVRIYAGGPHGVRLGTIPLGSWTEPAAPPVGGIWSIHAFEPSPLSANQAFVATADSLFVTGDRGASWGHIPAPRDEGAVCGGAPFVEAARRNNEIDVYYGTWCKLHRLTAPVEDNVGRYALGTWRQLEIERSDRPRDLVLFNEDPVLLATNGGIQNTTDLGLHWRFAGGGRTGGYNAIQVAELKGQSIGTIAHTDLYAATRDNHFWAADADAGIEASRPVEAFFIEAERRLALEAESRITWRKCGACETRESGWHFNGESSWSDPIQGRAAPVLIRRDQYVQNTLPGLAWTANAGMNWQPFAAFDDEPRGIPRLARAGAGDHAIVYQAIRTNLSGPPAEGATRLLRIQYSQGNGVVVFPGSAGFGGLGISRTPAAMYPVFGVDSRNAFHVIAPDIINRKMMETWNGGEEWKEIPGLTGLITGNGERLFHADLHADRGLVDAAAPLVTAVSFSPDDPRLVLIGTREGGIFMSGDRGATWSRINNSERVTSVTSFYWHDANTVFVSTYGRGLWKLQNIRVAVPEMFDELCGTCNVVSNDEPGPPPFDGSVLVFDGRALGVRTEKGRLRELFVTPGSSVVFTGDQQDLQPDIAVTRSNGRAAYEPLPEPPDGWIAAGVVFTSDDTLTGTVFAESERSLLPPELEGDFKGSTDSPSKGRPYIRLTSSAFNGVATVAPEEVFSLSATGFAAGAAYEVLIDGVPAGGEVTAEKDGSFTTRIAAPSESGYHRVEVRLAGDEAVIDGSTFLVVHAN